MRITTTIFAACLCVTIVNAWPLDQFRSRALDRLMVSETDNDSGLRSKRTIGLLRQFFPEISKRIEDKVNMIIGEIFKIFGPAVIGNLLGGQNKQNNANGKSSEGSTVEAKSPFDDDDDSFIDDDDFFNAPVKEGQDPSKATRITVDLPRIDTANEVTSSTTTTTEAPGKISTTTDQPGESTTPGAENVTPSGVQDVNPEASETNQVVNDAYSAAEAHQPAESQNNEVKVQFADEAPSESASEGELAPLEDIEVADDENRNKRFLNFGFGASGGNGGGSGGGSGNFLFDIIRQAADGAARAAGTVYRVVAGTQSLGLGLSASRDIGPAPAPMMPPAMMAPGAPMDPKATKPPGMMTMGNGTMPPLISGGGSSASDPAAGAPEPGPQQEAVPGPATRLFVIANRGISNLIQDLILRLAATSERIVNFKARLITSII